MMLILTYINATALLRTALTYCWVVFINKTENNTITISKFTHTSKLTSYKFSMTYKCPNIATTFMILMRIEIHSHVQYESVRN